MKRLLTIIFLIALFSPLAIFAKEKNIGLGIILGEPTGVSLKKWTGSSTAIDGAAAWSFTGGGSFHLHIDYLVHNSSLFEVKRGRLLLYYGLGGRLKTEADVRVGFRIPVGLNYEIEDTPLDVFFEIAPMLDLAPNTKFWFTAGVGIRYFF
jgi:hypothetical protein